RSMSLPTSRRPILRIFQTNMVKGLGCADFEMHGNQNVCRYIAHGARELLECERSREAAQVTEIARTQARQAVPAGLLGMLVLVAAFELFVAGRDRFSTDQAENWRFKAQASVAEASRCQVLCFGDSMVEFGLVPGVVERGINARAYNLALHGGTPASS